MQTMYQDVALTLCSLDNILELLGNSSYLGEDRSCTYVARIKVEREEQKGDGVMSWRLLWGDGFRSGPTFSEDKVAWGDTVK